MKLITWNCKGAFYRKHDFAASLCPDVLVVPECEKISTIAQPYNFAPVRSLAWFGENSRKGLAVISYGDYSIKVHPSYDSRHKWIVPVSVSGPVSFLLFAVWTVPLGPVGGRYVRPLLEALDFYTPLIGGAEVVWAGDFNSNYVFDRPRRTYKFCDFVGRLSQQGLHSAYHSQRKCAHGEEAEKTFYLHHKENKGYHIDYVFTSGRLHPHGLNVSVGSHADWSKRSDHAPLICEFHENAQTNPEPI